MIIIIDACTQGSGGGRRHLKNFLNEFVKDDYNICKVYIWDPATFLSEKAYNHIGYYYLYIKSFVLPKFLNIERPQTFNEKIIWLKMNHQKSIQVIL